MMSFLDAREGRRAGVIYLVAMEPWTEGGMYWIKAPWKSGTVAASARGPEGNVLRVGKNFTEWAAPDIG